MDLRFLINRGIFDFHPDTDFSILFFDRFNIYNIIGCFFEIYVFIIVTIIVVTML